MDPHKYNSSVLHYEEGWNARIDEEPFDFYASRSWKEGWLACDELPEGDRKLIEYTV